jgi:hypothetical protein
MRRAVAALLLLAAGLLGAAAPAGAASVAAAPVTVRFSFVNGDYGGGIVEGVIRGLQSDGTNQVATSLRVTRNAGGFGLGEYIGPGGPEFNQWVLEDGVVTNAGFLALGALNAPPQVTTASLQLILGVSGSAAGLSPDPGAVDGRSAVAFTVVPVPLPASALLIGLGVGALALLSRSRRVRLRGGPAAT